VIPTWHSLRRCANTSTPDFWVEDTQAGFGIHECRHHCPVFDQCQQEQLNKPQPGVYAGELWVQTFNRGRATPVRRATHQPREMWCTHCQISYAISAKKARTKTARTAPGATVSIGASDAA